MPDTRQYFLDYEGLKDLRPMKSFKWITPPTTEIKGARVKEAPHRSSSIVSEHGTSMSLSKTSNISNFFLERFEILFP